MRMAQGKKQVKGLIEKRVLIQASPAIIYKALTDAKDLSRWFCDRASSDPHAGGELTAHWTQGNRSGRAIYQRITPGSLVELKWVEESNDAPAGSFDHILTYSIRTKRGASEVHMCDVDRRHADEETMAVLDEGWNYVLMELKDYCERKERSARARAAKEILE